MAGLPGITSRSALPPAAVVTGGLPAAIRIGTWPHGRPAALARPICALVRPLRALAVRVRRVAGRKLFQPASQVLPLAAG
jgi:hypothetical protein